MNNFLISSVHIMTEEEKRTVCCWQYPAPYHIYNTASYDEMVSAGRGFANPDKQKNYYSYYSGDTLAAYTNFSVKEDSVLIGISLAPELCGKGYGENILRCACRLCRELYPDKTIFLQVRTWNIRAIKCYEKAGFSASGRPYELSTPSGKGEFITMKKTE